MRRKLKENLFYIGIVMFCIVSFGENTFFIKTNLTSFLKGLSIGLEFVGLIIEFRKKEERKNDNSKN